MKRLVMIVDDDPVLQRAMTGHLQRMSFDVVSALHYEAAVAELATCRPTLVCVDLELPTQSGYELCEYIRGPLGLTLVPILVTSESGAAKDMASAEDAGANAFLKKPFSMDQLSSYVEALLAKIHLSQPHLRRLQL